MAKYAAPRGMRDFYPEEYRIHNAIFNYWRKASKIHGFEFYDSPVVETLDLLERKSGEEISEQIYTFVDKSNRRLALRPELTPSLARMIISRQKALNFPVKWSAIGQCFRYERMTRGRKREHYQWNLDIIGEESVMAEAEVLSTAIYAIRNMGLTSSEFKVHIGSRSILGELFDISGINKEYFAACFLVIDKLGKISKEQMVELLKEEGVPQEDINKIFDLMSIQSIEQVINKLGNDNWSVIEIKKLFSIAKDMGFEDYLVFDISIIRGLAYYTGIVFEAFDVNKKFRAIFGGGRYNNLLSKLGGNVMPCVGLGFGDVVISELLDELNKTPGKESDIEYSIGFMDTDSQKLALKITAKLREKKHNCDMSLKPEKPKTFFKKANRINASKSIYIGSDEIASGAFKVKDMLKGESLEYTLKSL
ncbi:MAG: histidine--tRNA ligase [bacterium]|nr:histidine--tRNA ligase [bacterium]